MYFIIRIAFILLFVVQINAQSYTLDEVVNLVLQNHPQMELFKYKIIAAENNAKKLSNLPDPILTIGLNNLPVTSFAFDEEMMTSQSIGIMQKFPFPGKLDIIEKTNSKNVSIINYQKKYFKDRIRKEISTLFYQYEFLKNQSSILEENKSLNVSLLNVVETRYSVNKAQQKDIFKLQLRINEIDEKIIETKSKAENILSTISILSNSEVKELLFNPVLIESLNLNKSSIKDFVFSENNKIKSLREHKTKADLNYRLSKFINYPNFSMAFTYAHRGKLKSTGKNLNNFLSVKLGISIPINYGGKNDAAIEEASSNKSAAEANINKELQFFEIALNNIFDSYSAIEQKHKIVSNISLIQANESYSTTLTSYMVGKSDIGSIINSLEAILNLRVKELRYLKDMKILLSDIELLTSKKISELNLSAENQNE